jgi:hypothetical protein
MEHNYKLLQEEASKPERDVAKLTELVLHMAFYWYNFMPLSRGTAAVGTSCSPPPASPYFPLAPRASVTGSRSSLAKQVW